MSRCLTIYTDGACQGNPGPAGLGVVVLEDDKKVKELSKFIGDATNNIAEYEALIFGLEEALILKADELKAFTDSELMQKQVTGQYKVKHPNIKPLHEKVARLIQGFNKFEITAVRREFNKDADRLATEAINKANDLSKQ